MHFILNFTMHFSELPPHQLKKVSGVHLAALADLPFYVPPPITDVMTISFKAVGLTAREPRMKVCHPRGRRCME